MIASQKKKKCSILWESFSDLNNLPIFFFCEPLISLNIGFERLTPNYMCQLGVVSGPQYFCLGHSLVNIYKAHIKHGQISIIWPSLNCALYTKIMRTTLDPYFIHTIWL